MEKIAIQIAKKQDRAKVTNNCLLRVTSGRSRKRPEWAMVPPRIIHTIMTRVYCHNEKPCILTAEIAGNPYGSGQRPGLRWRSLQRSPKPPLVGGRGSLLFYKNPSQTRSFKPRFSPLRSSLASVSNK